VSEANALTCCQQAKVTNLLARPSAEEQKVNRHELQPRNSTAVHCSCNLDLVGCQQLPLRFAGKSAEEVEAVLAESRKLLHERRAQRPRPHLDDKVLVQHVPQRNKSVYRCSLPSHVLQPS
jgi:hypothetical protein